MSRSQPATTDEAVARHPRTRRQPRRGARFPAVLGLVASAGLWTACGPAGAAATHAEAFPAPAHVVVVVLENHQESQIIGNPDAPFINSLASGGAVLTDSHAVTHPSQPNYYALFSGDTQGVTDDHCITPGFSNAANLATELADAGHSWGSYNEDLPGQGDTTCRSGLYAQKHNPWFGFGNVPTDTAHTFDRFPQDFGQLPDVSFVIPNLCNDMHDCPVATGDSWLKDKLGGYADWAQQNDSLLIVTFDEDDSHGTDNRIPTVLHGRPVAPGSTSGTRYDHYDVLHTIESMLGTAHAGRSATASDITGIWR